MLENMIKGDVKMSNLLSLEDNIMGHMDNKMEDNMKRFVNILQNLKENIPTGDDVSRVTKEDKDSVHVEQPSINKNIPRGIDYNNGSNLGWSPRGIQIPKIGMRKFDGKDSITSIF